MFHLLLVVSPLFTWYVEPLTEAMSTPSNGDQCRVGGWGGWGGGGGGDGRAEEQ